MSTYFNKNGNHHGHTKLDDGDLEAIDGAFDQVEDEISTLKRQVSELTSQVKGLNKDSEKDKDGFAEGLSKAKDKQVKGR